MDYIENNLYTLNLTSTYKVNLPNQPQDSITHHQGTPSHLLFSFSKTGTCPGHRSRWDSINPLLGTLVGNAPQTCQVSLSLSSLIKPALCRRVLTIDILCFVRWLQLEWRFRSLYVFFPVHCSLIANILVNAIAVLDEAADDRAVQFVENVNRVPVPGVRLGGSCCWSNLLKMFHVQVSYNG